MIIECPKCKARYQLDEKHFAGRKEVQIRCAKCETSFPVKAPVTAETVPSTTPEVPQATVVSKGGGELPRGKRVSLSVTRGQLRGKIFPVTKPRVVLGRQEADIVVDDPEVSRKHCALEIQGMTAVLMDLGSVNGTFVDEQNIQTSQLQHLSEFRIGTTTIMLTVTDQE